MTKYLIFVNLLLVALEAPGCMGKKCPYRPSPIFEEGLPHVVQYKFEKQGQFSLESVLLDTKVLLEVEQDVCERTRQEYRFTVQGNFSTFADSLWVKETVRQMTFLSTFSPKQASLRNWATAIEQQSRAMRLGEDVPVQEGITARIDRISSPEQTTLRLILAQQ